jgi:hypothetical protein
MSAIVAITTSAGTREIGLSSCVDAAAEERAVLAAHGWIKTLRHARVDGEPLRRRFTVRDDSLWWFAELYLHKRRVILEVCRTIEALEGIREREAPVGIRLASGSRLAGGVVRAFAAAHDIAFEASVVPEPFVMALVRMDLRARALRLAALSSRLKSPAPAPGQPAVAAFVHRAFWRGDEQPGSPESYIGPVLEALERRLPPDGVRYIGVGPPANFQARRWWHALRRAPGRIEPVEGFAPLAALEASNETWHTRHTARRALDASRDIREHAVIRGCDCWPIVRQELAGIALLQWPWSVRAMDEAGAALDALEPEVAITYAEAGGWGRALMLEARRRAVPSAGLQHGFIYRHWLNYLHEPDEMEPDAEQPSDRGFPRPDRTLLFDAYAAGHLEEAGRFPGGSLVVTGSPRLDALVEASRRLTPDDLETARQAAGCAPGQALGLVVTKFKEARHVLPDLIAAVAGRADIRLAIKAHPAETTDVYAAVAAGHPEVTVLPADAPLAPLLGGCRAVITVNSTVALDAAVLGVPALVVGLPNNLSPFVEAGALAGAARPGDIAGALDRILYDEEFRQQLDRDRRRFLERFAMTADGRAAERSADAVMALAAGGPDGRPDSHSPV